MAKRRQDYSAAPGKLMQVLAFSVPSAWANEVLAPTTGGVVEAPEERDTWECRSNCVFRGFRAGIDAPTALKSARFKGGGGSDSYENPQGAFVPF